ncbi:hypothetical protein A6A22_17905 [Arthrobacter sp. OY3WO11]|nr:hypothetical protein A6A22_17905 [Arthrobacter sp. OY3WO11]
MSMVIGVLSAAASEDGTGEGCDDDPSGVVDVSVGEDGRSVVEAGPFEGVLHPARGNASKKIAARANFFRCMGDDPFQS